MAGRPKRRARGGCSTRGYYPSEHDRTVQCYGVPAAHIDQHVKRLPGFIAEGREFVTRTPHDVHLVTRCKSGRLATYLDVSGGG